MSSIISGDVEVCLKFGNAVPQICALPGCTGLSTARREQCLRCRSRAQIEYRVFGVLVFTDHRPLIDVAIEQRAILL